MKKIFSFFIFFAVNLSFASSIVSIKDNKFIRNDKVYQFYGANFWQAAHLASPNIGHLDKLKTELDTLKSIGVSNIRVMVLSEGPETEPYRVVPALQQSPDFYNKDLLIGIDQLLVELNKRNMTAVMVLGNFWPWSGGFAQWVSWFEGSSIPYPPPHPNGSWSIFQEYSSRFYANKKIQTAWKNTIKKIITRTNSISGKKYSDDPAIFSWQLANEPRGAKVRESFLNWVQESSNFIRSLDENHLISLGSEGETIDPGSAGNNFVEDHQFDNIDYTTFHLWVENWGIYDPRNAATSIVTSIDYMKKYVDKHVALAMSLNKPVVMEEFGISRDSMSYDPDSSVNIRDRYYSEVFEKTFSYMKKDELSGVNFWAWSGMARPAQPYGSIWKPGHPLLGDPPHEHQGWYGVYNTDKSTLQMIKNYNDKVDQVSR